eukprot:gene23349-29562_t
MHQLLYLNFVTRIDRPLMEKLAQELVATNSVGMVAKIYDQYLDLISLEPYLFTLNIKDSFMRYNEASLSETDIRKFVNRVGTGLLSMVRVLGSLPIIRSPRNGAAEMLAADLCAQLKENISVKGPAQSLFGDCMVNDRSRPLLLIFDRACDLFPIFQHNSTYQALVSDLLDFKLNRVTIELKDKEGAAGGNKKKKTYDLNTQIDQFLATYASVIFPQVVEANTNELADVSKRESAMRSRPDSQHSDPTNSSLETKGRDLGEAIESLPDLMNRKANLEAHTNILHAAMEVIGARAIPTYFDLEQSILNAGGRPDRASIISMLKDPKGGWLKDKVRLLALVAATNDGRENNKANNDEYDKAFTEGCLAIEPPSAQAAIDRALHAVAFVRRMQSLSSPLSSIGGGGAGAQTAILSSLFSNAISKATQFFAKFTPYYITRVVDNLAEGRACPEADSFTYFDPKARDNTHMPPTAAGHKYSDVIIFVVGGGSYAEFYNIQEMLKGKAASGGNLRNVMYGCTEMLSGDMFIDQLERLGAPATVVTVPK